MPERASEVRILPLPQERRIRTGKGRKTGVFRIGDHSEPRVLKAKLEILPLPPCVKIRT